MRKNARLFRVVSAAALLISMLAATVAPAAAQQDAPSSPAMDTLFSTAPRAFVAGANTIYYPWVANDDNFGLGAADTSISVQNLEDRDSQIWIYAGNGNGGFDLITTAYLSAYASKTFTAAQLGFASGEGGPVAVVAANLYTAATPWNVPAALGIPGEAIDSAPGNALFLLETPIILSNPITANAGGGETTQVVACVVNYHTSAQPGLGVSHGYVDAQTGAWVPGPFTQQELQEILNDANAGNDDPDALVNPFGGLNSDGDCGDMVGRDSTTYTVYDAVAIGGVAKTAVEGEILPMTTMADTAVSGYNALNGLEVSQFNEWYLPIVQTNCGPGGCWDSMIRVANLSTLNSAITIRFFPADDGSGSLQTGFQVQQLVNGGDTWHVNLGDLVPDGWVGSAHIYSDGWVFAMVDRYKVGYSMWITNTGSAANFENVAQVPGVGGRYALFAPHVLMDWYGWNTGINVANLVNQDNNISIQYFNLFGNATQVLSQRLAPHGMTYFYDPSVAAQNNSAQDVTTDPNAGVVGSAIIWSDHPVAAAVDATKYPETDPRGGPDLFQATSYNATQNIFTWQAFPLVQKGNPADGMGATSGINIMNPNPQAAVANVYWVNPSGFLADNFGVSGVSIPGFANGFVYTLWQRNLPNGFIGSAQVISNVPVVAVSANVDYQVDGDGSAIFNSFNPCGLYRTPDLSGNCFYGDPFDTSGRSVTKFFVDEDGDPVQGVNFYIIGDNPDFPFQRNGVSGPDGSAIFTNVPVGDYELHVVSVPAGYQLPANPADVFRLNQGEDWVETNVLLWNQGFEKTVFVAGSDTDTGEIDDDTVLLAGVNVTVYHNVGTTQIGGAVAGAVVFNGLTDADGFTTGRLAPGNYILCIWDEDGDAVTPNGETVNPDLAGSGAFGDPDAYCELFTVVADVYSELFNDVEITEGVLNVFVTDAEVTETGAVLAQYDMGVAGVEVCLTDADDILIECKDTDINGFVEFHGVPEGDYTMTVQADGLIVVAVDGGEYTVSNEDFEEDGASVTPAVVTFNYSPTADLAQDGWLDDVDDDNNVVGTVGLTIFVEESTAQLVIKTVTLNGEPVEGATIQIDVAIGFDGQILEADTETNADGEAVFIVEPGTYLICSTVEVILNPDADEGDQETFNYTICDSPLVVEADFELYELLNEHVTGELTKIVEVRECADELEEFCTEYEPAEGANVTVEIGGETFGPYTTDITGEVTVVVPVDDEIDLDVCSDVNGDEICEGDNQDPATPIAFADVDGTLTAEVTNPHTVTGFILGQIDILNNVEADPRPGADQYYCIEWDNDGSWEIVGESFDDCVAIPLNGFNDGPEGYFFNGLPSGTYRLAIYTQASGVFGETPDVGTTNSFEYSVVLDYFADGLADIENPGDAVAGRGDIIGTPDFTQAGLNVAGVPVALTVTALPGARITFTDGACGTQPDQPGPGIPIANGDGEVTFTNVDPFTEYCIQVFDSINDAGHMSALGQFPYTTGSYGDDQVDAVDEIGATEFAGVAVVTVEHWVGCNVALLDYSNYAIDGQPAGFTPSAGSQLATALGEDGVCDATNTADTAIANIRDGAVFGTLLTGQHPINTDGNAYFLLPVGGVYHQASEYVEGGVTYQNNTSQSTSGTFEVDVSGNLIQWEMAPQP